MKGSLWTAYQAATAWSTHVDDSKRESKHHNKRVNREDKVRKMLASDAWKHLETNDINKSSLGILPTPSVINA